MLNDEQNILVERVYSPSLSKITAPLFLGRWSNCIVLLPQNSALVTKVFQCNIEQAMSCNAGDVRLNFDFYSQSMTNVDVRFNSLMQRNLQKLSEIASFGENWNGYGAKPISSSILKRTERIIRGIFEQPDLFPTADDSIQMEYEKENGAYLEIQITDSKVYEVFLMKDENSDGKTFFIDASIQAINEQVKKFYAA